MTYNPILSNSDQRRIQAQKESKTPSYGRGSLLLRFFAFVFAILLAVVLVYGYLSRADSPFFAGEGPGYYFGLIGGCMMLFILIYPAAKSIRWLRQMSNMSFIYRTHIIFGLLGPTLILFHANFSVDSLNSKFAMAAMLTVVASGIIGRIFHLQVRDVMHEHLYQYEKIRNKLLRDEATGLNPVNFPENAVVKLQQFEQWIGSKQGFWAHLLVMPVLRIRSRRLANGLVYTLKKQIYSRTNNWDRTTRKAIYTRYRTLITSYFYSIRKTANFIVYERLFSIWRLLHLPLFIFLIFTVSLHVIFKHMYGTL